MLESGGSGSGGAAEGGAPSGGAGAMSDTSGGAPTGGADAAGAVSGESNAGQAGAGVDWPPRDYPDIDFVYDPPPPPDLTPEDACGKTSIQTAPIPLDMYIVLDRSGSMNLPQLMPVRNEMPGAGDCNVGDSTVSRWCYALNALDGFFTSSVAAGTGVALQFFPAGQCTASQSPLLYACCSSGACCGGAAEGEPVVPLGTLPEVHDDLVTALNEQQPWADRTPIEAALRGMLAYTKEARRPGRQMLGLLITDGGPEGCNSNASTLASLVKNHLTSARIPTYVVATQGAAYSWLETIAKAGGAPSHTARCAGGVSPCHFYDVGDGNPAVFKDVLQQIRRSAIACTYKMPSAEQGLTDPNDVALSWTPAKGGASTRVSRVARAADCSTAGGFYYDNASAPTSLSLCPTSCDALRSKDGGDVQILLGCRGS